MEYENVQLKKRRVGRKTGTVVALPSNVGNAKSFKS